MNDAVVPGGAPRWRVFPVLALGTLMATLDLSIVNIALPTLSRDLHAPLATVAWVVLAYVLTITGLLLGFGRLADRLGRRRIYGLGLGVFSVASLLCALAPGAGALIAARTLQGVGAAMMTANSTALLAANFPADERGRALGAFGAMVGVGLGLGPPIGGLIIQHVSWRWIFLINLPLGALALLLLGRIASDPPRNAAVDLRPAATALWCAGLVVLMLALGSGPAGGWGSARIVTMAAIAIALLAACFAIERRAHDPLLPRTLAGPLGRAATLTFAGNLISIVIALQLPLYLEGVAGFDPARSGRWVAVVPLAALLLAPSAGHWSDRWGSRPLTVIGLVLTAVGCFVLGGLGVAASGARLIAGMAIVGVGQGLFSVPNARAILGAVRDERLGVASGLQGTMRNLGFSAGAALAGALLATRFRVHGGGTLSGHLNAMGREAFAATTADTYDILTAISLIAALIAVLPAGPSDSETRPA